MRAQRSELAEALRRLRTRPLPGHPKGLSMGAAARRTELWEQEPLTTSYWAQVERGESTPTPQVLLRMALVLDAGRDDIARLFRLAGYGFVFDTLAAIGDKATAPTPIADEGIMSDNRLPYPKRLVVVDHLNDSLEAIETRRRREEEEKRKEGEKDGAEAGAGEGSDESEPDSGDGTPGAETD